MATSVDGVLTGRGADLIIIDNPLKPNEALSDTTRQGVNGWFDGTLYSRLNDKSRGAIVLIMQRLHEDDLTGHLLDRGGWNHLSLSAIAERDETYTISSALGKRKVGRRVGEALHPAREDLITLEDLRQTIGKFHFASQYQQTPVPREGGLVKRGWFKSYEPDDLPRHFDLIVQSWNTANKATELSDYSVCTSWGLLETRIYLLHVLRKKLNYPDLKRAVREQADLNVWSRQIDVVLIED